MEAYGLQDWVPSHEDIQASPLSPRPFVYGPASSNPSPPYHRPQAWWQQLQQECTNQPRHFPPNSADHQWQQDPPYQHPFSQANQHLQHATIQQPHLHHQPCSTPEHRQQPYQHERSHPQQAGAVQALKQAATMTEFSSPEICNPLASTSFVLESVQDFACAPPRLPPSLSRSNSSLSIGSVSDQVMVVRKDMDEEDLTQRLSRIHGDDPGLLGGFSIHTGSHSSASDTMHRRKALEVSPPPLRGPAVLHNTSTWAIDSDTRVIPRLSRVDSQAVSPPASPTYCSRLGGGQGGKEEGVAQRDASPLRSGTSMAFTSPLFMTQSAPSTMNTSGSIAAPRLQRLNSIVDSDLDLMPQSLSIVGRMRVGEVIAVTSATMDLHDPELMRTARFQWQKVVSRLSQRNEVARASALIRDAEGASYTLREGDQGYRIRVALRSPTGTCIAVSPRSDLVQPAAGSAQVSAYSLNERVTDAQDGGEVGGASRNDALEDLGDQDRYLSGHRKEAVSYESSSHAFQGLGDFLVVERRAYHKSPASEKFLAGVLKSHALFAETPAKERPKVIENMFQVKKRRGDVVVAQGDYGYNFYIIEKGECSVVVQMNNGGKRTVNSMRAGASIGDLSFAKSSRRTASVVVSSEEVVLWAINQTKLHTLLEHGKGENASRMFKQVNLFSLIPEDRLEALASKSIKKKYAEGAVIIRKNDAAVTLFVIYSGEVTVESNDEEAAITLGPRQVFGTESLVPGKLQSRTCVAATKVKLLALHAGDVFPLAPWCSKVTLERQLARDVLCTVLQSTLSLQDMSDELDDLERVTFQQGELLAAQNQMADMFLIIKEGHASVQMNASASTPLMLGPGQSVGARSLMNGTPHAASAVAASPTVQCLALNRYHFQEIRRLNEMKVRLDLLAAVNVRELGNCNASDIATSLDMETLEQGTRLRLGIDCNPVHSYIVRSGTLRLTKKDDTEVCISTGERVNASDARFSSMTAETTVVCYLLKRQALEEFMYQGGRRASMVAGSAQVSAVPEVQLEDVEILRTIGVGQFGRVKLVRHKITGECFALKCLQKEKIGLEGSQSTVRNEVQVMRKADSPFVVRLVNVFKDKSQIYLLIELCLGGELYKIVEEKRGGLKEEEAKFYCGCVLLGLQSLHKKYIVYRDLKPENLVLDSSGYCKLIDLGCAKPLMSSTDRTFTLCGTTEYLCPEMVMMTGHSLEADLWQFGIFVYEMIHGKTPFGGNSMDVSCKKIMAGVFRDPRNASPHACDLIRKLLVADPKARLGAGKHGWSEIKEHKWFKHFDWEKLQFRKLKPPVVPKVQSQTDTRNFFDYAEVDFGEPAPEFEHVLDDLF